MRFKHADKPYRTIITGHARPTSPPPEPDPLIMVHGTPIPRNDPPTARRTDDNALWLIACMSVFWIIAGIVILLVLPWPTDASAALARTLATRAPIAWSCVAVATIWLVYRRTPSLH